MDPITCPNCDGTDTQPDDRGRYLCVPCGMTFAAATEQPEVLATFVRSLAEERLVSSDDFPFSHRPAEGMRECPLCEAHISDGVYAVHWLCVHSERAGDWLFRFSGLPLDLAGEQAWCDRWYGSEVVRMA